MTFSIQPNLSKSDKIFNKIFKLCGLTLIICCIYLGYNYSSLQHSSSSIKNKDELGEDYFINKQNLAIFTFQSKVDNPVATIIYVHGYGDYHMRNLDTFKELNSFGISCYAIDLQGHGKSDGERAYVVDFEDYVDDVYQFISIVKSKNKDQPLYLIGNSMGGAISMLASIKNKSLLNGVVFVSPMFAVSKTIAKPHLVFISKFLSFILPKFPLVQKLDPSTYSHSKEGMKSFDDPLIYQGGIRINTGYQSLQATIKIQKESTNYDLPFFIAQSGNDTTVDVEGARLFFLNSISKDKKLVIYKSCLHLLLNEPIEFDGGGKRVIKDIANWILERS